MPHICGTLNVLASQNGIPHRSGDDDGRDVNDTKISEVPFIIYFGRFCTLGNHATIKPEIAFKTRGDVRLQTEAARHNAMIPDALSGR